ncbi:MAG: S-layer homology domain-containing protein, partial [Bacillota bacterium]
LAAGFSDIEDHARKNDILKLVSLGIIDGYPDGTFKPENTVTRAEFAKLIISTMGLGEAAKLMAGVPTPFSDVPATHWATGFINLAHSKDIVNGYPDGTFKPEAQVTYAEALKMILCAIGYTPEVVKPVYWPVTWVAKAVETGLNKGVAISANLPAVRGEVAALLENSLTIAHIVQTGFGTDVKYEKKDDVTFLTALGAAPVTGYLVDAPVLFSNNGKTIRVKPVDAAVIERTLLNPEDVSGLLGHKVKVWANADNKVIFVEDLTPGESVKKGTVKTDGVYVDGTKVSPEKFYVDFLDVTSSVPTTFGSGYEAKVIYESSSAKAVIAVKYTVGVVKNVSSLYKSVTFEAGFPLALKDVEALFSGAASELGGLQKGDVVEFVKNDTHKKAVLVVTRDTHTGTFNRLSGSTATIGDTKLTAFGGTVFAFSEDDLGKEVKAILNKDGKVVGLQVLDGATVSSQVAVILSKIGPIHTVSGSKYYVNMLLADGTKVSYEISKDDFDTIGTPTSDFIEQKEINVVVEYKVDDGVVDITKQYADSDYDIVVTGLEEIAISEKYNVVEGQLVTSDTIIFNMKAPSKVKTATFADLLANAEGLQGKIKSDNGKATIIVMTAGSAVETDAVYGIAAGSYKAKVDDSVTTMVSVLRNGSITDYVYAGTLPEKGDVVTYTVSGNKATFTVKGADESKGDPGDQRIAAIDGNLITVKGYYSSGDNVGEAIDGSARYYVLDENTQFVFKDSDNKPIAVEEASIGVKVHVYSIPKEGANLVKVLVMIEE